MNEQLKRKILQKIESYDKIIVSRHIRPDGDAIGSTKGLVSILRATYPNKKIFLINDDNSAHLAFLGGGDDIPDDKIDEVYDGALQIIIDTGTADRISNRNYQKAKELIKIDHHIDDKPYGDLCWIEDYRSSASEMIADFYVTFKDKLKITKEAATYIYCGMVTDSGRFRHDDVTGETMRLAGALLDIGIDTQTLFANLYTDDLEAFRLKSYVYENLKITPNGVAYIYVDKATQERLNLTLEQASEAVGELKYIRGSLIWIAFIDNVAKNNIRVRVRSRYLGINDLALKYHGGGHNMSAGATCYTAEEMQSLIAEADKLLGEYKATNGDKL
ncbi:MAG: bifunctional oligoribonuclease/PAP phosphatase NrnA [Clostridiales bacterium]|nr:bifunctional oligoribonuclease/PAP phosphatase NrnA [Clostridiales bacterium]